jgi:uncharacterized phiE125 gp8 family phage protein
MKRISNIGDPILSLDEAKSYLNREGYDGDDADITRLIHAAQLMLEGKTGLFIQKGLAEGYVNYWTDEMGCALEFGRVPIQSIDKVSYIADGDTAYTELDADKYAFDDSETIPKLTFWTEVDLPDLETNAVKRIKIEATVGYEPASIDLPDLQQMVVWLVVQMYVYRDNPVSDLNNAVDKWLCTRKVPNAGGV